MNRGDITACDSIVGHHVGLSHAFRAFRKSIPTIVTEEYTCDFPDGL